MGFQNLYPMHSIFSSILPVKVQNRSTSIGGKPQQPHNKIINQRFRKGDKPTLPCYLPFCPGHIVLIRFLNIFHIHHHLTQAHPQQKRPIPHTHPHRILRGGDNLALYLKMNRVVWLLILQG
jgi:hypothetical protein